MSITSAWHTAKRCHLEVLLHILVWGFILLSPQMISPDRPGESDLAHTVISTGALVAFAFVFYVNYLWLVPRHALRNVSPRYSRSRFALWNVAVILVGLAFHVIWIAKTPEIYTSLHDAFGGSDAAGDFLRRKPRPEGSSPVDWTHSLLTFRDGIVLILVAALALVIRMAQQSRIVLESQIDTEKKMLVSKTSPHFLLNTLNNIYALISLNPTRAQEAVHQLSRLLSYTVYETKKESTTLERETEFIGQYISLMKLRTTHNVSVTYQCDLHDMRTAPVAPMLLHPLVENAFKHGIMPDEPCHIDVKIEAENGTLHLSINNSNHPQKHDSKDRQGGIGLPLTRQRLDDLYGSRHQLKMYVDGSTNSHITDLTIHALGATREYFNNQNNNIKDLKER